MTIEVFRVGCYRIALEWDKHSGYLVTVHGNSMYPISKRHYASKEKAMRGYRYYVRKYTKGGAGNGMGF